jgi:hypothetical protein
MKALSNKQISKILYSYFESIDATLVRESGNIFKAMIKCTPDAIDSISMDVSTGASQAIDKFIIDELEEDPKIYNRSMILFESEPSPNNDFLFFRWFKQD